MRLQTLAKGKEKLMARKRLNKKVALIGSLVFAFVVLAAIGVILRLSRDPEKFIKDGDEAIKAAKEAVDAKVKQEEYDKAERSYVKARSLAKTDSDRVQILFKLVDMYVENDRWRDVLGCWNGIIRIEPENVKARLGRLNYFYIMADSGMLQVWQEVESQASEFIEVVEDEDMLAEDIDKLEYPGLLEEDIGTKRLGPYLYLLRGRAALEITRLGAITDPDASLAQAVENLEKVKELEPANIDAYQYLAQALITKGQILASRGNLEERDKVRQQAQELLEQAVEVAGDDPRAYINLLTLRFETMLAQEDGREQIQSLEPEYVSLVEKFDSSAMAFSALTGFYRHQGLKNLDKAIQAVERAIELDSRNVGYVINATSLLYRDFSIYGHKPQLYRAVEMAENALTLPDAQDKPGPRQWANRMNRILLYSFLANCYIEQVLEPCEPRTEAQSQGWLTNAERAVHEIEQFLGSGEDPQVIKWRGMLELAKGNESTAIRSLYAAYEQLKASGIEESPVSFLQYSYSQLSYILARIFEDTSEAGAVREFLESALKTGIAETKPEALLDYVEVLLKLKEYATAFSVVEFFEQEYWANERSQTLRTRIYIAANQFDKAEEQLANSRADDPEAIKLSLVLAEAKIRRIQRAMTRKRWVDNMPGVFRDSFVVRDDLESQTTELQNYNLRRVELVQKLLPVEPNLVEETSIIAVCDDFIKEGKVEQAGDLVNQFLEHFPSNTAVLFYKHMLSEPKPDDISQQRRKGIQEQVLSEIADPTERSVKLGAFYQGNNEPNKAAEEFKKVLKIGALPQDIVEGAAFVETEKSMDLKRLAAEYLLDFALDKKDWELAEQIAGIGRRENLDNCQGQFFATRLALAKEQYRDALAKINECLRQKPVFSPGFVQRSNINAALGNEDASIKDARRAASLNPLDGTIAKSLANVLYRRNERLGDNVLSDQLLETRAALDEAIALNPTDLELLSFYAEYIIPTEPMRALAIRQRLQKNAPSLQNAILLARLAARLAFKETDAKRKEALFAMADSSFEQARLIDPHGKTMLSSYAEYRRLRGQEQEAKELLAESEDERLLWAYYFRGGQFEEAREVLEQLYQTEPNDTQVVSGLLLIAERTSDQEAAEKYSEELLALQDNVKNRLLQIQTFLKVGLVKEAEYKLQSFKEKYPGEPRALLLEAWLAMRQGQLERALELTNRNLEADQDNAQAWRLRGEINHLLANYEQAIIDLKRSISLSPEPVARVALAKAYRWAGRAEDAITELKNTIDHPQAPEEGRRLLEEIYLQLNREEELKRFYDETLNRFPDDVLWHNRAGAFAVARGNFSLAERLYKQAWEKGKGDEEARSVAFGGYLQALILNGKLDKVFEEAHNYVDSDFAPVAFFRMAQAKAKLDDRKTAIEYCRKAIDKAGTSEVLASEILRGMHTLLGAEEVLSYCKERLQTNPDSLAANFAMYHLMNVNGEYNKALGYIDKCLQIAGSDNIRRVDYTVKKTEILTAAYGKTSDNNYLKRAIAEYESLLAEMPNNTGVLNNLAYMLAESNEKLEEALEYSRRAYRARPNDPSFLDTYAYVLYKNGRSSEAAEFLQSALQQYESRGIKPSADVYEHLGMIKEALGLSNEAIAAYKQALERGDGELSEAAVKRITSAIERVRSQDENSQ